MSFDNPKILFFLFALVVFIVIMIVRYRKSRDRVALFAAAAPSHERSSLLRELRLRLVIADVFYILFVAFLIVALAGPRWGFRIVNDYRRGADVILAFDLSQSMNVSDCFSGDRKITRLERGIEIAGELAASLNDIRLGVVIGRGGGITAVPLTYDTDTILNFLYGLDTNSITGRGTNLEALVNAAAESFQDSIPSRRAIVLFSDGEALSGSFQNAVEKARKAGLALSAAGLGSNDGGPVPAGLFAQVNDFLQTDEGVPVISARQEDILRFGADRTGGVYVDGGRKEAAMLLSNYIYSLSAESRLYGYRREASPHWQVFIFAAMACLMGSRIMGFTRRKKNSSHAASKKAALLTVIFCAFFLVSCSKIQSKLFIMEGNFFNARGFYTEAIASYLKAYSGERPYAEYGLGSAYFALEEGSAALERYEAAASSLEELKPENHVELRYRILYNTGIIHFEKGNYEDAVQSFRDALKIDGSRIEAKRNLELSLLTVQRSTPPQAASAFGGGENSEDSPMGSSSILFEYLKEMEQEHWKSRKWNGESNYSGPDY